jgi:hypothetical protein
VGWLVCVVTAGSSTVCAGLAVRKKEVLVRPVRAQPGRLWCISGLDGLGSCLGCEIRALNPKPRLDALKGARSGVTWVHAFHTKIRFLWV